jgi:hypothetical protein
MSDTPFEIWYEKPRSANLLRGLLNRNVQEIHAFAMEKSKELQGEVPVTDKALKLAKEIASARLKDLEVVRERVRKRRTDLLLVEDLSWWF